MPSNLELLAVRLGSTWLRDWARDRHRKQFEKMLREIGDDRSILGSIVEIFEDVLDWQRRVRKLRTDLESAGDKEKQFAIYSLAVPGVDHEIAEEFEAPESIRGRANDLLILGKTGSLLAEAYLLCVDLRMALPDTPDDIEDQMDRIRKLDGCISHAVEGIYNLRMTKFSATKT